MVKIKIFVSSYTTTLETAVNNWLGDNMHSDILNIQYRVHENGPHDYSVCITYRDVS